ncbi:MAG: four helix bundle protein [Gemmatimonadota bacterium]
MLPHERLEAYWLAEEYVAFLDYLLPRIMAVSKHDGDQLDRSAGSLVLNLIEAAADKSPGDKVRFFRYSRREVSESYGVLMRHYRHKRLTDAEMRIAKYYADRLSATLWSLMKKWGG